MPGTWQTMSRTDPSGDIGGDMRTRRHASRIGGLAIAVWLTLACLPALAAAAPARPEATTDRATNVSQVGARLNGSVIPNERATTVYFEYGATRAYGARTPDVAVGNGNRRVAVGADIAGLAPATRYHYRLVARNVRGTAAGEDRAFTTQRQPLGLILTATPNPIRPGGNTIISGTLAGTGNAGRQVQLLGNPFPFSAGLQPLAADIHLTNAQGGFSFPVLGIPVNTQFSVRLPGAPDVASPVVTVGVAVRVGVDVDVRRTRGASIVRLRGKIRPAHRGALVAIQRLRRGTWVTIDGTVSRRGNRSFSRYSESVTIGRRATLRVLADIRDGDHVAAASRTIRVRG